jgi:MOSC domain-containing protein YiiM/GNAT superfamily N-acetyltransferase
MSGRVVQVNVSPGGVPKLPVDQALVGRLGLDGDAHHHDHVHGGPHRAVCLLALEAIERVQADGHPIEPGAVGENLTTVGIEIARLPVGAQLAIGEELLLEIAAPANPCDVIKHVFVRGKSGRISILLHPDDSRMYARVLREGVVREGDPIRVLPPAAESTAALHHELDLLDSVEREAWLAAWRAAAAAGFDVRILDRGELAAAASPSLPGSSYNRAFGLRQIPIVLPEVRTFYADAGTTGWVVAGLDDPPWPGAVPEDPTGVHAGSVEAILGRASRSTPPADLCIQPVDPSDDAQIDRWIEASIAANEAPDEVAEAIRRTGPFLARTKGEHLVVADLNGRDVGVAASFTRRRVAWLGGAAVLPEARGLGIQRALILERVRRGADAGCLTAMATANASSVSAANLEAMGLPRVWTRARYRLEPADVA